MKSEHINSKKNTCWFLFSVKMTPLIIKTLQSQKGILLAVIRYLIFQFSSSSPNNGRES